MNSLALGIVIRSPGKTSVRESGDAAIGHLEQFDLCF